MNISLIQLEYLVALDKHRHFVRAAEASNVTQPTLSMQIKKLEDELDLKLFDRSKQPIIPTDIGKLIIEQAKQVLNETDRIYNVIDQYKGTVSGDLTIGIIPTISPYLMPCLIRNITETYPLLHLHVKELFTEDILKMLKEDTIDIGILATPLGDNAIQEDPLFYEKFMLYVNPSHPSYDKPVLTSEDILQDKIWLLSEGNCFRNQSVNLCSLKAQKSAVNFDYESGSLETLKKIVDLEGGITVLPQWATLELSNEDKKNVRSFVNDTSMREISVIYSRNYARARSVSAVKEMILKSLPKDLKNNHPEQILKITA